MSCCKKDCSNNVLCNIIQNNIYFDLFLIGIICQFVILLAIIIDFYVSRNEYIWFNSRILTIKKIIKENYDNYKIYQTFKNTDYYQALNYSYYDLLKNSSKSECGENLKECGILDTYGNKLCLYKDYPCPINEIIVDLKEKRNEYINKGYNEFYYYLLKKNINYSFYYTNTSYDKQIISSLFYVDEYNINIPNRFIGSHNFVFDIDAFEQKYEYKTENVTTSNLNSTNTNNITDNNVNITDNNVNITDNNDIIKNDKELNYTIDIKGGEDKNMIIWSNASETKFKLMQASRLEEYIDKKLNKSDNNNDTNYTQIFYNIYIKNFVGFENAEQMDIFNNTDFTIYKNIFPHNIRLFLVMFFEVLLVIFVIIYIRKLMEDKEKGDNNVCKIYENFIITFGMSIYFCSFLYFYSYFIVSCYKLNKNNKFSELKKIKADKYIEEFISDFISRYNKRVLIAFSILFFTLSFICYLILLCQNIIKVKNKIIDNKSTLRPKRRNIKNKKESNSTIKNDQSSMRGFIKYSRERQKNEKKDSCLKRVIKCDIFKNPSNNT